MGEVADTAPEILGLLVTLSRWLGNALQYSPRHPSCVDAAAKVHEALTRELEVEPQLSLGILRDQVTVGSAVVSHPVVRARIAAHLHQRGVLVLRFMRGLTVDDLTELADLLLVPVQTVFDRGGLRSMVLERGLARIQIEELAHELTDEQREAGLRRQRLRDFFAEALRDLLARREIDPSVTQHLAELLAFPEIAVTILEDQGAGLAEAAAGMALMTRQEEERTGQPLAAPLRAIFAALPPLSRDRVLLGFPPLVGEFRDALAWALGGYDGEELARFVFPAVRSRASDLDLVLYALSVLVPHAGSRLSMVRRLGLMLHDLPLDDPIADDVLASLAVPVDECDSYRRERLCLAEPAERALVMRSLAALALGDQMLSGETVAAEGQGALRELALRIAQTRQFERFCRRLPDAAAALVADGSGTAVLELLGALGEVEPPEWHDIAARTAETLAIDQAPLLLAQLDRTVDGMTGDELVEVAARVATIATHAPRPALDHMEVCESPRLRQLLLDALPRLGPRLLPLLRGRLTSRAPDSVVHVITILPRVGGEPDDLVGVALDAREQVRLAVAQTLALMPPSLKAGEILVRYLADRSETVRLAARGLVAQAPLSVTAIAGVERILNDAGQPAEVHHRLIEALGRCALDQAAQLLFQLIQPRGLIEQAAAVTVRELAAVALKRCPAPGAPALFRQGLESAVRRVRRVCERAAAEVPT